MEALVAKGALVVEYSMVGRLKWIYIWKGAIDDFVFILHLCLQHSAYSFAAGWSVL